MPKKEFFNLDRSKQQIILDAARKEFTSMLYEDASINMIVKEANDSVEDHIIIYKSCQ